MSAAGAALLREALALRSRYDEEPSHSDHVAALTLQIFDGLQSWHKLGGRERELLQAAALLHDIGWSQTPDGRGHHKESARLIREYAWKHLSPDEVPVVAQIARYHRKTSPLPTHADFHALKPSAQELVMILGGILRLGDALDRTHLARVAKATASATREGLVVRVQPDGPWDAERMMFLTKRDMLQLAAGRPVVCEE